MTTATSNDFEVQLSILFNRRNLDYSQNGLKPLIFVVGLIPALRLGSKLEQTQRLNGFKFTIMLGRD